ncbi:hypothetical protein CC99x_010980 [Candidatus Berkiella cookevillensis]|uniref:Uncharacterized protein n=1 Tax=Candidatus Berkiella cookevillensis TaxID=437022 RepID=A0A0Q9YNG6_9GAMM|nr:hypothetical protein [Candidatus Berkiella cookevillensis]MCS5709424.1 hypothetical protein [Candidatus Berkiella cookevillensis]
MANAMHRNHLHNGITAGFTVIFSACLYSAGWSSLANLSIALSSGVGIFVLLKLADLCVALQRVSDNANQTVTYFNEDIINELKQTIDKANKVLDKSEQTLGSVNQEMVPNLTQTLDHVRETAQQAKSLVEKTSGKVDEMLSGQLVLQLGTAPQSNPNHSKKDKPH